MPYRDPEQKREWERLHRSERNARRRELRRVEAARGEAQPEAKRLQDGTSYLVLSLAAGSALAGANPQLAIATGVLTVAMAVLLRKGAGTWKVWRNEKQILALGTHYGRAEKKN